MTSGGCEVFYVRRNGKLRWKWRATTSDGVAHCPEVEYELFYECLSAARTKGFTPTYAGMRMFEKGDRADFGPLILKPGTGRPAQRR